MNKITKLQLFDVRNHAHKTFEFEADNVVFWGDNGKGKTNILESISILSTGKSWREKTLAIPIRNGESHAKITAKTQDHNQYEVQLATRKRTFNRNGKSRPLKDHLGEIPSLLFCPEFLTMFSGGKTLRLSCFDRFLAQWSTNYREALMACHRAHTQKTRLLKTDQVTASLLAPWNHILASHLPTVITERQQFLEHLNPILQTQYNLISEKDDLVSVALESKIKISPDAAVIEQYYEQNTALEIASKRNSFGASKFDFSFYLREQPITQTASRGEERSVLLSLLAAQKELMIQHKNITPILLLDDVFSELDDHRQGHLEKLCEGTQAFFTTTHQEHAKRFNQPLQMIGL